MKAEPMNTNQKRYIHWACAALALGAAALTGCSSTGGPVTLNTVGPDAPTPAHAAGPTGRLVVNTGTETVNDGDVMYYPHSSYQIYNADGSKYKYVRNHVSRDDESAEVVDLDRKS